MRFTRALGLVALLCCPCLANSRHTVALLTDFGLQNEAVGLCHGAILSINSDLQIVDISHNVDAYDIGEAALMLRGTTAFPAGTVFVCVVDPGVGTARQPCAMRTKAGYYYVGPNNGVFSYVAREQGVAEFVVLQPTRINPHWMPGTFDGRDLFSPAGAILATSQALNAVGEPASPDQLILLPAPELKVDAATHSISAVYLRTDEPYGNVWTNISSDALTSAGITLGSKLRIECGKARLELPFVTSFGHVEKGAPLAYLNSSGMLAFAINMGDFRKQYDLNPGAAVRVQKLPADAK